MMGIFSVTEHILAAQCQMDGWQKFVVSELLAEIFGNRLIILSRPDKGFGSQPLT